MSYLSVPNTFMVLNNFVLVFLLKICFFRVTEVPLACHDANGLSVSGELQC